jgi:large subunit ribosomal protein L32
VAAVPKRKISRTRRGKRRTHWKASMPAICTCGHCGQPTVPHRICPSCGFYRGREHAEPEV